MLKIGEFSKLSRVSIRMLRHYDDIGLLKPVSIDRFTGYRYYSPEQLPVIGRITALKDMGFALADIVKILDVYEDREALDTYLVRRQDELKEITITAEYQMRLLDTARISWVSENGYECAGPMFNIYHVSPHETQNPDEFVTEVCYPVK